MTPRHAAAVVAALAALGVTVPAQGEPPVPPWMDTDEVPLPSWATSVVAKPSARGEPGTLDLVTGPHGASARRGVS
ncbi:MAG: hypothetical protein M3O36_02905, partial [Myxococcota bacterium]|nr:hypothetical protein [Myxococcota bacterium]